MKILKQWVKQWLWKRGYCLYWNGGELLTGVSLASDLPYIMDRSDPLVFDVGANIGQTIDMILGQFPQAQIIAFEPSSDVFEKLKITHGHRCKQIHNIALGGQNGVCELTQYEKSVFNSLLKLKPSECHNLPEVKEVGTEQVMVRTLDSFVFECGVEELDLLKIDTQGFDLEVLRGAENLLASGKVKRVLVELNFFQMYASEADALTIINFLKERHFHLVDLYEKNRHGRLIAWCTGLFEWSKNGGE